MTDHNSEKDDPIIGKDITKLRISDDDVEDDADDDVLSMSRLANIIETFLRGFKDKKSVSGYYYMDKIQELVTKHDWSLQVDYLDLPGSLFDLIFKSTKVELVLEAFNEAVKSIFFELQPGTETKEVDKIVVRISVDDPDILTPVSDIDVDIRSKLIGFDCTIVSTSEVKSVVRNRKFKCRNPVCGRLYNSKRKVCSNEQCRSVNIDLSLGDSKLTTYQYIEVQERQDDRLGNFNSLPTTLNVKLYGELVNKFRAGDNVRILGILKLEKTATADAKLAKEQDDTSEFSDDILFSTVIEAHNMQLLSTSQDQVIKDPSKILSKEDVTAIEKFIKKYPNDNDKLRIFTNTFADYIHGYDDQKEFLMYTIVGSIPVELSDYSVKRAEINGFFVGDPGTVKTSLLKEAAKISIHGIYTSGKGSSGVGLTASIDNDAKGLNRLKVGAAVLADRGLCAVDEFLSINEDDREYLLECMENGTFHVNKGGINAILNTRAAFIMATNSVFGKYDRYKDLKDNVPITDQLFSRFDVIFVMRDIPNKDKDSMIADHVLNLYDPTYRPDSLKEEKKKVRVPRDFLFKYLVYARTHNLTDVTFAKGAIDKIKNFYQEIRHPQKESDVTATPRQLEGLIRLSIARARFMLRNRVIEEDSDAIIHLMTKAYISTGMMQDNGSVAAGLNLTTVYAGPLHQMNKKSAFSAVFMKCTKDGKQPCEKEDVIMELITHGRWDRQDAYKFWDDMMKNGRILTPTPSRYLYDLDA